MRLADFFLFHQTQVAAQLCDPDFYPVARNGGEQDNAIKMYPQIKADSVTYAAIVAHEHLPSGDLTDEQKLDGSTVARWELVPCSGERTYDLLPAGPTGHYWANGIFVSSTLGR